MDVAELVDAFVERVNSSPQPQESLDDVPVALRTAVIDEDEDDGLSTNWRIIASDNVEQVRGLEERMGLRFPPSFRDFVCRHSFPAFEFGPVMFFANTGHNLFWELGRRLFLDPFMSPRLLDGGYIQIGNPYFYNYDPICIESGAEGVEGRIVQFDHEAILIHSQLHIVRDIAPSFVDLMKSLLAPRDG